MEVPKTENHQTMRAYFPFSAYIEQLMTSHRQLPPFENSGLQIASIFGHDA